MATTPRTRQPIKWDDRFLVLTEVAEIARAPLGTVRGWLATGKLKGIRPGRLVLVRESELRRFLGVAEAA